jgi:hypothetical protein
MAQYSDLTPQDKQALDNYLQFARPLMGELARMLNKFGAINSDWTNTAQAIVATLDAGAEVPNSTGLSGANAVTKEDIQAVATLISQAITAYENQTNRDRWAKAAGAINVV